MMISSGVISRQNNQNPVVPNLTSWSNFQHRRILIFGDSIGAGANASPLPSAEWAYLLCAATNNTMVNMSISGQRIVAGATTPYVTFDPTTIPQKTDADLMLIINLGTNDARNAVDVNTYQSTLDNIIITYCIGRGWPANRIFIMGLYWYANSLGPNAVPFTNACQTVAQKYHTMFANMSPLILAACNPPVDYDSGDGVHPSTNGHLIISNIMQSVGLTPV